MIVSSEGDSFSESSPRSASSPAPASVEARLRDELAEAQSDLQNLIAATSLLVVVLDRRLQVRWCTPEANAFFGLNQQQESVHLSALDATLSGPSLVGDAETVLDRETIVEREVHTNGGALAGARTFIARLRQYETLEGQPKGIIVVFDDVTRPRRLEAQITEISEAERRRIGEDLHDMLASRLTAASMRLQNLRYKLSEAQRTVCPQDLDPIIDEIRKGAEETRLLSHALVPVPLYEKNLAAALQRLADEIDALHEPTCQFAGPLDESVPQDTSTALHLYRIAYEAVYNAVQHAGADTIRIGLERSGDDLLLTVADDGVGLSAPPAPDDSLGLHLMHYRADLIGATLDFLPSDDGGTVVRCTWPTTEDLPSES